jgi:hypothetical protein
MRYRWASSLTYGVFTPRADDSIELAAAERVVNRYAGWEPIGKLKLSNRLACLNLYLLLKSGPLSPRRECGPDPSTPIPQHPRWVGAVTSTVDLSL